MLLQSHENEIRLLPALPQIWKDGGFRGFKARGGFEVALRWRNRKLVWAELLSTGGETCVLAYGDKKLTALLRPGERRRFPEFL